ncbi:MAG: reductive dehalogenase domain-containing protein [Chloroflexota bacterium]
MDGIVQIFLILFGSVIFLISLFFAIPSFSRYEHRAGLFGLAGASSGVVLLFISLSPFPYKTLLGEAFLGLGIVVGIIYALPIGRLERGNERPSIQVDERIIMFARYRLEPGDPRYDQYYSEHPEHKYMDDAIRKLPGLLSLNTPMADPLAFAATDAGFFLAESLKDAVSGTISPTAQVISHKFASEYVKQLAKFFGAHDCGIAEVKNYQVYSHIGRGAGNYGEPIVLNHPYVVVFTFEMAEEMVRTAPRAQESMETARQYSEAAQTAVLVAAWIRAMGYQARAHIDGNYRLILPLAARDAGLGEIGRMGLLMTPDLGPRVRLSAVSTTLPLVPDPTGDNPSVLDFCTICKKCAENCPSHAISMDDRQEIEGALRWKIDSGKCFHYWNVIGTDCGRCLMVCPYSHGTDVTHNIMRSAIAHSGAARRLALFLDDLIYLRKPKTRPGPFWTRNLH